MFMEEHLTRPVFLHGYSHQHHAEIDKGWLSLKSMWQGEAVYWLDNGRITLNNSCYLILNEAQPYTIHIEGKVPVESFCIFFPAKWAGDVLQNFLTPTDRLLEEHDGATAVSFYDVLHRHDQLVTPILQSLRQAQRQEHVSQTWQTETLHHLLAAMLQVQRQVHQEAAKLPAIHSATRKELYRRLHIGRDYLHDNWQEAPDLEDVAQVAALSPYHFLRSFKQLFGQTPHAYLTTRRLKKAKQLLANTNLPITEICLAVGFQSLGSFSTLFQRVNGRSPSQFRREFSSSN